MMKQFILLVVLCLGFYQLNAQGGKAYQIYNKKGQPVSFDAMTDQLSKKYDLVLFGEEHNNAILHWLEFRTAKALYAKKGNDLILGAEMFERDDQQAINAYLADSLNPNQLARASRLWPNFKTDYKPLLDFVKEKNLSFIATNIPRRYAQIVAQNGLDSLDNLSEKEKTFMVDLPIKVSMKTPGYKEMEEIMPGHAGDQTQNYIKAQAIKDATMAESVYNHWRKGQLFLHFNGNFHSKGYGGIYWYLKKKKKFLQRLRIAVIGVKMSNEDQLPMPEDFTTTEFTIVIPDDMTKTY